MKLYKKIVLFSLLAFPFSLFAQEHSSPALPFELGSQTETAPHEEIHWMNFNQAMQMNMQQPRKVIIDVYTNWCGWCKHMDKITFQDTSVINYINKNYYAIKLNAETRDTFRVMVQDQNGNKELKKFAYKEDYKANELALTLLNGKMGYPTTVFLDEKLGMIQPMAGFIDAEKMHKVLVYYGENYYKQGVSWEDFEKNIYKKK